MAPPIGIRPLQSADRDVLLPDNERAACIPSATAGLEPGKTYLGGSQSASNDPKPQRVLKAIDYQTGATKWEIAQPGGLFLGRHALHRDGAGILRRGDRSFVAADATRGRYCGASRPTPNWHASPWPINSMARSISPWWSRRDRLHGSRGIIVHHGDTEAQSFKRQGEIQSQTRSSRRYRRSRRSPRLGLLR